MKIRRFQIAPGKHLVLPLGLFAAPGATHHRMHSGMIVELDFDAHNVKLHSRFLNNRIKLGDLVEVGPEVKAPELPPVAVEAAPAKPFEINPPIGGK